MHRNLTITVSDDVYRQGLYRTVGRGNISQYVEDLLRPHVVADHDLTALYREVAAEEAHEREAMEWIEAAVDEGLECSGAMSTGSTLTQHAASSGSGGRP